MITEELQKEIDSHKIISFDIFDTLLIRPYVKPTDLFLHLEELERTSGFAINRIEAEKNARKKHHDQEDITLEQIYNEIATKYQSLQQNELDLEKQVLRTNPDMKEIYEYALSKKKKIIVISDMYLSSEFLKQILHKNGYTKIENVYVSNECGSTKATGKLYQYVMNKLGEKSQNIFHIGDNIYSDIAKAKENGISSYWYQKRIDALLENDKRAASFYQNNKHSLEASILLGSIANYFPDENVSYWETIGYVYAGPTIYAYMLWLNSAIQKEGIKELLFVARDGYTLEKVFNIIKTQNTKTHYFYAPRTTSLLTDLCWDSYESPQQKLTFAQFTLNHFSQYDSTMKAYASYISSLSKATKIFKDNHEILEKFASIEKEKYRAYLKTFEISEKKVGLVDTITQLFSSQRTLAMGLPNNDIIGYYWYTLPNKQKIANKHNFYTFSETNNPNFADWDIMELLMTAPTPPIDSIKDNKPIFKEPNAYEQKRIQIYPAISEGAIKYAQYLKNTFKGINISFSEQIIRKWINTFCLIATDNDKTEFSQIQHAWDAKHEHYVPLPKAWFPVTNEHKGVTLSNTKIYLLNLIPFIRKKETTTRHRLYLFCFIPFYTIRIKSQKRSHWLFNCIPLFSITKKDKNK